VLKIELLSRSHDRERFDCGSEALNGCLRQTARQHTERGISRTFVVVDEEAPEPKEILGYFTVTICQIRAEELLEKWAKKLPREVSGVKLGRLAVAKDRQRQGLGTMLLMAALDKVALVFESAGGIGLFVEAKDEEAKAYYERFGFEPLQRAPLELFLPLPTIQMLRAEAK
jgi:GNAT superfamily N-acetyltransferase